VLTIAFFVLRQSGLIRIDGILDFGTAGSIRGDSACPITFHACPITLRMLLVGV